MSKVLSNILAKDSDFKELINKGKEGILEKLSQV